MITRKYPIPQELLPFALDEFPEDAVFFDIETTGLSRRTSHIFIIGAICKDEGEVQFIQWFVQRPSEEKEVVAEFSRLLAGKKILLHYNGQTFDVPYVQYRAGFWGLKDPFSPGQGMDPASPEQGMDSSSPGQGMDSSSPGQGMDSSSPESDMESQDLYQKMRGLKDVFHCTSMKQKDAEKILHFPRKDQVDGKELLEIYHAYIRTGDKNALEVLLLHNRDDLFGMLTIYRFLLYIKNLKKGVIPPAVSLDGDRLYLKLTTADACPANLEVSADYYSLAIRGNEVFITLQGLEGCFRHYYPNYKDYFYLPLEDTAIHKSVGIYVDPSCRQKAKADTCYTKKEGLFFFQPSPAFLPEFRQDSRKGPSFFSHEELERQPELLAAYAGELIAQIFRRC